MTRSVHEFVQEAITGSRAKAVRDAIEIARLEGVIAQLEMVNKILVDKLEWFADYVKEQDRPRLVAVRDGCRLCVCGRPMDQPCDQCETAVAV